MKKGPTLEALGLFVVIGRGGGIRTHDPLLPKQMRYQAALRPDKPCIIDGLLAVSAISA